MRSIIYYLLLSSMPALLFSVHQQHHCGYRAPDTSAIGHDLAYYPDARPGHPVNSKNSRGSVGGPFSDASYPISQHLTSQQQLQHQSNFYNPEVFSILFICLTALSVLH